MRLSFFFFVCILVLSYVIGCFVFFVHFSNSFSLETGEMKAEITKLHKKLFEQEKKLQNSVKLLQLSKHQEKVIFDQCK